MLRNKFLLSFALIITALTCATLFVVRRTAERRVQQEIKSDALNAILAFQVVQHQHQLALRRKADLLASLALIRNGDAATVQDVGEDPWQSGDCDLFVLADGTGKIIAVHTKMAEFPEPAAQTLLQRSLHEGRESAWWYSGTRIYQVVLQGFYDGPPSKNNLLGTVIVGREIDRAVLNDLSHLSSSQVAFRYGSEIVASTLPVFKEHELTQQFAAESAKEEVSLEGERFFASSIPLGSGTTPVSIIVLKSYTEALAYLEKQSSQLAAMGLLAIVIGGVLVYLISEKFTRPLGELVNGVHALERGDFAYPLHPQGRDEVAQVTRSFSQMRSNLKKNESQKQQLEQQLRQSQKMEAIGRLAGGVAHDFNNLLTVIKGHGDLLLDRLPAGDPLQKSAHQIDKAADRATSLTRQLLAFCRMQVLQPKIFDLNSLVSDMCSLLKRLVREDISFQFEAGDSLGRIKADPGQIEQVIMNLTVNACDAMPNGGKLVIETKNISVSPDFASSRPPMQPGDYVLLSVTDSGCGMDESTKARIFEPFFTTKEQGKGTGLGLATVYGVVKQSGGCIWVQSEPGAGASFEVYLPIATEPAANSVASSPAAATSGQSRCVLIVEDEEDVRELASQFLTAAGYKVLVATDGQEALVIAGRCGQTIRVLVTDVVMPNMRGPELAKRLRDLSPELKVIYTSGYLDYQSGSGDFLEDGFFLQKPFSRESLAQKMAEAFASRESSSHAAALTLPVEAPRP